MLNSLCARLCGDKAPAKDSESEIKNRLQPIKKVWLLDVAAEDELQGIRWVAVRRKLQNIELSNSRESGVSSSGPSEAAGKKQKSPDKRLCGKQLAWRRSGPYAGLQGPLDSSEGESSHCVESPKDCPADSSEVVQPAQTFKR